MKAILAGTVGMVALWALASCGGSGADFQLKGACDSSAPMGFCIESYADGTVSDYTISCSTTKAASCPTPRLGTCQLPASGGVYSLYSYYSPTTGSGFTSQTASTHCTGLGGTFAASR